MFRSIWKWLNQPLNPPPPIESFTDPIFGDCQCQGKTDYTETIWWTTVELPEYKSFRIFGRGVRPTTDQVSLWNELKDRFPKLIREARASIPEPPFKTYTPHDINIDTAELKNIRFGLDGTVQFFFDLEISDGNDEICPLVVFKGWRIVESYWCV